MIATDAPAGSSRQADRPSLERALASEALELWRRSRPFEVRSFLARHPELAGDLSLLRDLAYREYRDRLEAGEELDPVAFAARYPACGSALQKLVGAAAFVEDNAELWGGRGPTPWPEPGEAFLGFELVRELGRGSFSRVFLARDVALGGRHVALKVSRLGGTEAATLGRLAHPNVVPVHSAEADAESGLATVCMPYLGSATLADLCRRVAAGPGLPARAQAILDAARDANPPAPGEPPAEAAPDAVLRRADYVSGVLHLGAQLADALAFIHRHGVCHRDLKPSNVLLTPAGRPMLLDFNLSADPEARNPWFGGTLAYMPPEQLRATAPQPAAPADAVDGRSDLFALGVLLYELLAGRHPFGTLPDTLSAEEARAELLRRQREGPAPLRQANPALSPAVARLVESCLAFPPEGRPRDAAEVARTLRRAMTPGRLRRWLTGPALRAAVVGAAVTVGAIGGAGLHQPGVTPADARRELELGDAAFRRGNDALAIRHLTRTLQADLANYAALVIRGRAYLRQRQFGPALADFEKADDLVVDGKTRACRAYCLSMLEPPRYREAIQHYERARKAGCATPEVLNNLGYLYFQAPHTPEDLKNASNCLSAAIDTRPDLQAAWYNRALLGQEQSDGHAVPLLDAIHDMEVAIQLGPATDLYRRAADLYALAAQVSAGDERRRLEGQALDAVKRAIDLGQPPDSFAADPCLSALQNDPRLWEQIARPPSPLAPQPSVRNLDPSIGFRD
jgi:serine/threonine protein kinase/Flp pilus assembly protein TadD